MNVNQTQTPLVEPVQRHVSSWRALQHKRLGRSARLFIIIYLSFLLLGGSAITATETQQRQLAMETAGWGFDLLRWEYQAIGHKIGAFFAKPAQGLSPAESTQQVQAYLARAEQMSQLEEQIDKLFLANRHQPTAESNRLQTELEALRRLQYAERGRVEQVIEGQIGRELAGLGLEFVGVPAPPVQFTFVEPPKKLVVSRRDRIEIFYSQMLDAAISLDKIQAIEQAIRRDHNLSAYVTNIGGLGAFPTMVVDRASLWWILSTVAHEWTHNYLSFFPLGLNYATNPDLTTLNETVAEIVGNEVGERALRVFYPNEPLPPKRSEQEQPLPTEPPVFDFEIEMRQTRLTVDALLALGQVDEAERYMEARRIYFVENGYPLRALNQAYFAFHGSYGTSPASTSPIGPKLERLRELIPDLKTFLTTVRGMTSEAELDAALAQWEK